jgi:hypothetical protein
MRAVLSSLVFSLSVFCSVCAYAAGWVTFMSDDNSNYAYVIEKVSPDSTVIQVWAKAEARDEDARRRLAGSYSADRYKDFLGTKNLIEINCKIRTLDILSTVDYRVNGEPLNSVTFESRDAEPIPPGSRIDKLADIVCKEK